MSPLVILGLALLPGVTVRAADLAPPAGTPPVRSVLLRPDHGPAGLPGPLGWLRFVRADVRDGEMRTNDRISMVLRPAFPNVQDTPEKQPGEVTIALREPSAVAADRGPSAGAPTDPPPILAPRADPQPEQPTPATPMSDTSEPADALAEPPTGPPARPEPDKGPEIGWFQNAEADPGAAPQEPADTFSGPPIGLPARPEPDAAPDAEPLRTAGTDPDPALEAPVAAPGERPQLLRDPAGSLLPPPAIAGQRSEQLEYVARQADIQIRRGFELAGRRGYFAARSQFIGALRLVAQGLDTENRTDVHSRSLAAGLTAVKEAEDFIPSGSRLEADLDIAAIIVGHRTPVLKNTDTENLTPLSALKCYFTFAQEQLAAAAGGEVAGSMALHALGKLHGVLGQSDGGEVRAAESKAVTFYQAALLADPHNYMAANDLGVLLARCGNCREAEHALKYSLSIRRQPTGWRNLAVVYRQLGQAALAQQADRLSEAARREEVARRNAPRTPSPQPVRWVDPATFSQFRADVPAATPPRIPRGEPAKAAEPSRPTDAASRSALGWPPWGTQEERR